MGFRSSLSKVWLVAALLVACGDEGTFEDEEPRADGLTSDASASTVTPASDASAPSPVADAGRSAPPSKADAGDAGRHEDDALDAGASEPPPQAEPDASTLDAGSVRVDASVPRRDASVALPDASAPVDAGSIDPADYSCEQLNYESFGRAFMKRYCNNCHSAQKPTLLTLETVALNKAVVMQTTVTTTRMPLKSGNVPSAAERVQLGVWLNCGPY